MRSGVCAGGAPQKVSHERQEHADGNRINSLIGEPWNPGQGRSGLAQGMDAASGRAWDLPPHGNRDASSPPHMPLRSAGKHRQRSPTD
eukprot:5704898-Prymnesium_polylepis.1